MKKDITLTLTAGEIAIIMDALHALEVRYSELCNVAHECHENGEAGAFGDMLFYEQHGDMASDTLLKIKNIWRETQGYRY